STGSGSGVAARPPDHLMIVSGRPQAAGPEQGLAQMTDFPAPEATRIAVVGLGYVGLPLAVEFGKRYDTVGFDINAARIAELRAEATRLSSASELDGIADCNVYIVTVPTPIDSARRPDLAPLRQASEALGKVLRPGDTVIYESTVYPGCTEEVCVPILEQVS